MEWFGKPIPQNRFLGLVDSDDSTNLPAGLASLDRNFDFTRDSGGPTQAVTRAGHNTAMQLLDSNAPVTGLLGFVYSPESSTDPFFQLPMAFQPTQGSQYESPVGSGFMVKFPQTNFTEPQNAHAIQVSAGNKVYSAYSDLVIPLSGLSCMDPKLKTMNPFGMKPFGWNWTPGTPVLQGEVCTPSSPSTGNGHTYQAQNSGTTAALASAQPIWPLTDGGTVNDNGVVWKEHTMVIANRLPPPAAPLLALAGSGGIPSAQDVYIVMTLLNSAGETLPSVAAIVTTVAPGSSVNIQIPNLTDLPAWIQNLPPAYVPTLANVYVAIVPTGSAAPALSTYGLHSFVPSALGAVVNVTGSSTLSAPPSSCTARVTPGQLPTPTMAPIIDRDPGAGTFPAGRDVYVRMTYVNNLGETPAGPASSVISTNANDAVQITVTVPLGEDNVQLYEISSVGIYEADVETGQPAPPASEFSLVGYFQPSTQTPPSPVVLPIIHANVNIYGAITSYTIISGGSGATVPYTLSVTGSGFGAVPGYQTIVGGVLTFIAPGYGGTGYSFSAFVNASGGGGAGGGPVIIKATATGPNPPLTNTTGPGGAIVADTATGGANGGQGYRYAACMWINENETFSGFTLASVVNTTIDEDGWEIGVFNVPLGMPNVVGRCIAFSVADSSQAGPFNWIGLVNLQVPSQNVVYPTQTLIDAVEQSATVFLDNTTTQGTFNFTDEYLIAENNVDDRLDVTIPPQGVRVDYLESLQRLAITGVPGLASGAWISLGSDFESFYGDTSPVPISSAGDVCYGITDQYKGIPIALMKSGGFTLSPNTGNPASWSVNRRWGGTDPGKSLGPCGFRAWDACGKFIIFAHRSGLYKYDEADPDMMSKEVSKLWDSINWAAASTICVKIDEDTHTVIVLAPTGASPVPNQKFVLSYLEGWNNPIHFSTYSGKEISMDAARRWSPHDLAGFLCLRMERTLPPGGNAYLDGPTWNSIPDSSFQVSQLLFASSSPDGTVQARTPGIFSDNGTGIDCQYETMSSGLMQAVCKPEGFNLNACGYGTMLPSFVASRAMVTDQGGKPVLIQEEEEVIMEPIAMTPKQIAGITRKCAPAVNEFWRVRFRTDGLPGSWFSLKAITSYMIPVTPGRDSGDR